MVKTRKIKVKSIESYIHCTRSNIVNVVPTNLQVQLEQYINLFQDKPNCSTDALVKVCQHLKEQISENVVIRCCEPSKTFPSYPDTNESSKRAFSAMNDRNCSGVH